MYNSPVCYKHKGQKTPPPPSKKTKQVKETNRPPGEDLWWTEVDETQRCDDNPELHYGICEFDAYDGICFHCKNLVHPDLHLLHLIHNDRNLFLNFEEDLVAGEMWGGHYRSRLSDIWEEFAERDIMFEAQLGYGAARAEAIQKLCYADKEHILSVLKENLSKAGAPTEGEGTEPWVWNSLEGELEEHFERIRDWDITRVNWSPEEWSLERPEALPSSKPFYISSDSKLHPFGWVAIAAYVWYVFDNNLLDIFMGVDSSSGVEILCFIFMIPVFVIHKIFSYTPKPEQEVTTEDKKIPKEAYELRLKISSGVLAISFLLPWWWYSSGFQALRWTHQEAWFVLTEARLWAGLDSLGYIHWQMSTLLPLVFVATFVATWSRQQDQPEFGRKASNFHLLFFAVWYLLGIYIWGEFLPNEWNYAVFIAAASGIGLHPTAYGLAEKLSNATSE
jgi:hypothetical protein